MNFKVCICPEIRCAALTPWQATFSERSQFWQLPLSFYFCQKYSRIVLLRLIMALTFKAMPSWSLERKNGHHAELHFGFTGGIGLFVCFCLSAQSELISELSERTALPQGDRSLAIGTCDPLFECRYYGCLLSHWLGRRGSQPARLAAMTFRTRLPVFRYIDSGIEAVVGLLGSGLFCLTSVAATSFERIQ